jgi:tetratricopeptide (TPR) repeat protein
LFPRPASATGPGQHGASLGPLTEVGLLRHSAEAYLRRQSALPAASILAGAASDARDGVTPDRRAAARRSRERGMSLVEAGRLPAALSALRRAARLDPGDAASHHALGRLLLRLDRLPEATASLRLATTLRDDAAAFRDLGLALRRQGLHDEAVAAYRRAVALDPQSAEAQAALGDLFELSGDDKDAAQCFHRAAESDPDSESGRLNLARGLMLEQDFAQAEIRLRDALTRHPHSDALTKFLGDVLVRQGRFGEAGQAFDRALELNPLLVAAHFTAVETRRCSDADRPRLARMRCTLADDRLDDEGRLLLHFALGKLLDDLGDYAAAMRHFDSANRIRGAGVNFDAAAFRADVDRLVRRFTPGFFAGNAALGRDDETPLLIVGLPRSGTTLVEQIVSSHPRVAAGGELGFWIKRANPRGIAQASYLSAHAAHELAGEYLALLRRIAPGAARVTDKLPFNVLCLGLIHLLLPRARIIQCRRHPVDTCLSIYFTHFKQVIGFASAKADLAAAYREYARLMDHWRAVLPRESFLEIEYEELIADREAVTRRLIAFSGLEWHDGCLQPERNQRPLSTASLWQARQPVYATSVGRWRNYAPLLGELGALLPDGGAERARGRQLERPAIGERPS